MVVAGAKLMGGRCIGNRDLQNPLFRREPPLLQYERFDPIRRRRIGNKNKALLGTARRLPSSTSTA